MKYTITHNYGMMPNQIKGVTDDGRHFYFRGREGRWQLHFGATFDEAVTGPGYEGEEEKAGWFELHEWETFFWEVTNQIQNGTAQPIDWDRLNKETDELLVRLMTPASPEEIAKAIKLIEESR